MSAIYPKLAPRNCLVCNILYSSNRRRQKYCRVECRRAALHKRCREKYTLKQQTIISLLGEVWKDLENYKHYRISNLGRIKSNTRTICRSGRHGNIIRRMERLYNPPVGGHGYLSMAFSTKKRELIHRLVAMTFIPNAENKPCVNHIDGNKLNNCASNLEWVTRAENNAHAQMIGLSAKGVAITNAKLTDNLVREIRHLYSTGKYTQAQLARICNCQNISKIINKKDWKHVG